MMRTVKILIGFYLMILPPEILAVTVIFLIFFDSLEGPVDFCPDPDPKKWKNIQIFWLYLKKCKFSKISV